MFSSCDRDNDIDKTTIDGTSLGEIGVNPLVNRSQGTNEEGLEFDCFVINYTFALVDLEGVEHLVSSDEDLEILFTSTEQPEIVDFIYPLTASTEAGEILVDNIEDLEALFATCTPLGGWEEGEFPAFSINNDNSCYELVYPVTVKNEGGDLTTIENESELNEAIAADIVFFEFPIELLDEKSAAQSFRNNPSINK